MQTRFIVIDDDPTNNMLSRIIISGVDTGLNVQTFEAPEKGLEYIRDEYSKPHDETRTVLFLDINMPSWTGWDFLEHFGKLGEQVKKQIQIYMVSSSINARDKQLAEENTNVVDYIRKPLNSKVIAEIIKQG